MNTFSPEEIDEIDRLWRAVPVDHVWTGWAAAGERPERVWIFRTKAHWRRFPLIKRGKRYCLLNEQDKMVATASSLKGLLMRVEAVPDLGDAYPS